MGDEGKGKVNKKAKVACLKRGTRSEQEKRKPLMKKERRKSGGRRMSRREGAKKDPTSVEMNVATRQRVARAASGQMADPKSAWEHGERRSRDRM